METQAVNQNDKVVVLVAIDFSPLAEEVLETAANLARNARGELHLVHVTAEAPSRSTAILSADRPLERASEADADHVRLERLAKQVGASIPRIVLHTRIGRADLEIAQLAQDIGADLLVVGAGGASRLERLLLGSVAESLVRNAPCPVLAYRPKSVAAWERIQPACPDCIAIQRATQRARLWCDRHEQHHPRAHSYSEIPSTYGMGSQTFRGQ
jgi:nucleotide-binding universal stress UspA family protein